jgi:predicted alpha/beta hydrolase
MARRSSFDRPRGNGLTRFFCARGWRVITFDFRGHGDSGPSGGQRGTWGYDDLVTHDLPAVAAYARARAEPDLPVALVGHSLGGHVALAAQGTGRAELSGIVGVGANIWLRHLEPSLARWLAKRAVLRAALALSRRAGRFPARTLGAGSDDESLRFFEDFERFARTGWVSRDGREDYTAALRKVTCPVLQLISDGDRLTCSPECGEGFLALCGGERSLERISRTDDGGPAPSHMGMVTSGKVNRAWERVEAWMRGLRAPRAP